MTMSVTAPFAAPSPQSGTGSGLYLRPVDRLAGKAARTVQELAAHPTPGRSALLRPIHDATRAMAMFSFPSAAFDVDHRDLAAQKALLREQTGSWLPVFAIIIAMDALTGILALAVLKPMRRAYVAK